MKKKFTLFVAFLFCIIFANATTYIIQVANYQFTPSTVNAQVGDTIEWVWSSGFHNTTSTSVPAGAATWASPITTAAQTFSYKLTTAGQYSYWCTIHAPNMAATLNVSEVLPVLLTSFQVSATSKSGATVNWVTANEQNTAFYSIQRSSDGNNFTEIGRVNAAGNSVQTHAYSFTDDNISANDRYLYYYLEIVDKDGAKTKSDIKSFKNLIANNTLIKQVSPNPLSGTCCLMLQFNADKPGKMLVQLYSNNGRLVTQTYMTAVEGINNGHLHVGTATAGTYMLVCSMNGQKETKSIVVQ